MWQKIKCALGFHKWVFIEHDGHINYYECKCCKETKVFDFTAW